MVIFGLRVGKRFKVEHLAFELRERFGEYRLQDVRRDLAPHVGRGEVGAVQPLYSPLLSVNRGQFSSEWGGGDATKAAERRASLFTPLRGHRVARRRR